MKPRILIVSEFSDLSTGYAVYTNELLKELSKKYTVAELASYVSDGDPRLNKPWKVFPVMPHKSDEEGIKRIKMDQSNSFGKWRFEQTCLQFKPTHVITIRDKWFDEWVDLSPYRKLFNWAWLATVDAPSQHPEWLDLYSRCDTVLTYNDWSRETLEEETHNHIKVFDSAPPATPKEFRPLNKEAIKQQFGLQDKYILGTVMRNQKRKLFPDLFSSFREFLNNTQRNDVLLYCHTSYPDQGWDIPTLLLKNGLSSKVLFTYVCSGADEHGRLNCNFWTPRFFSDVKTICPKCNRDTLRIASVKQGVPTEVLSVIYNMFDLYTQYATCLIKGEEILTKSGWKEINNINIGEEVWTHKNRWKKVINTWSNLDISSNKKILNINVANDYQSCTVTENHKFYSITNNDLSLNNRNALVNVKILISKNKSVPSPTPKEVSSLSKGDLLAIPINDTVIDKEKIDWFEETKDLIDKRLIANDKLFAIEREHFYPRYTDIDEDFCRFLGLYIADGSASRFENGIQVTCHSEESKNIVLCQNIMSKISGKTTSISNYKNRNVVDIITCNNPLNKWCKTLGKTKDKELPEWCLYLPIKKQKAILHGLFMGDGCQSGHISIYSTISVKLAEQIKFILRRLRIVYSVCKTDRSKHNTNDNKIRQPMYTFEVYNTNIKNGNLNQTSTKHTSSVYYNNYHLLKIKSISEIDYTGDVFNLEVEEDHSMTTRIGCTPQCEGFGMSIPEAAACGVPVTGTNFSAMKDTVKKTGGIPIDVLTTYHEMETGRDMSIPDKKDFVNKITEFFNRPAQLISMDGEKARLSAEKNYGWDKTIQTWINYIESVDLTQYENAWQSSPNIIQEPEFKEGLSNRVFVKEIVANSFPRLSNSYIELKMVRNLNSGIINNHMSINLMDETAWFGRQNLSPFSQRDCYNYFINMIRNHNKWEQIRSNG